MSECVCARKSAIQFCCGVQVYSTTLKLNEYLCMCVCVFLSMCVCVCVSVCGGGGGCMICKVHRKA